MLVATPYRAFDGPRVISEVRKSYATNNLIDFRPKLAGNLGWRDLINNNNSNNGRFGGVRQQRKLSGGYGLREVFEIF
jgi:hypothetical protein